MLAKIMIIVLVMSSLLGLSTIWVFHVTWGRHERAEVKDRGTRVAAHLAVLINPLLRAGQRAEIQQLVTDLADVEPEINRIQVFDEHGQLLAIASPAGPRAPTCVVSAPLGANAAGRVTVEMSEAEVAIETARFTRRMAVLVFLITVAGCGAIWGVLRFVTRPMHELVASVRAIKAGAYKLQTPVHARDEVGELAVAFNELAVALDGKQTACRQLMGRVIGAAEDERKRVARELHDHTGQALALLIAGLNALSPGVDGRLTAELRELTVQTLEEVHGLSVTLRPMALDDLGLAPAMQKYCRGMAQRAGIAVSCELIGMDETTRLPSEIELALYRIGQEALTNAVRHGHAHAVQVVLQRLKSSMLAIIQDDGVGFAAKNWREKCVDENRLGLLGMEERVALLGGTLRVESQPGTGTSVLVEIPLKEADHA